MTQESALRVRQLRAEARAWRKVGLWAESYPRMLTTQMLTGAACYVGGVKVIDAMIERLASLGCTASDPHHYHEPDYVATAFLLFAAQCEDEARALRGAR